MKRIKTDWPVSALVAGTAGILVGIAGWQRAVLSATKPTFDGLILSSLTGAALFAAALVGGHFVFRGTVRGRSAFYALTGALAGLLAFLATGGLALVEMAARQNLVTLALGLPLLVGALLGFIYQSGAGIEDRADDRVAAIEHAVKASGETAPALIDTGADQYFSGPMEVRFSLSLMFAAGALLGAIMAAIVVLLVLSGTLMKGHLVSDTTAGEVVGMTVSMVVGFGVLMLLPTLLGHYAAKFFKATSSGSYVGYGFLANVALGLVTGVFLVAAPFAAATLALYRRLAGLQPVDLPDDVHVRDRRTLIAGDHPARRYHRVIAEAEGAA